MIFDALASNDIDVYVDYSGTLWLNQFHHSDIKPREELLRELKTMLAKQNITLLGELGFENAYALVMPRKRAEQLGIRTHRRSRLACVHDVDGRGLRILLAPGMGRAAKGLRAFIPRAAADAAGLHVCRGRVRRGRRDRGLYQRRADREIRPRRARRCQTRDPALRRDVLLAPKRAGDQALRTALQPLLGKIDIATMREANLRAAGNDADEFARRGGAMAVGEDREAIVGSAVIAERSDGAIHSFFPRAMDCFAEACHRARVARPGGSP